MGSPLTPALANICIEFYESGWLNEYNLNNKFTIQEETNHSIDFFDIFISGINNQNLPIQINYKPTYKGLLLNFKCFASFSYNISLIKYLIDI